VAPISLTPIPRGQLGSCGVALANGAMCSFNCTNGYEIAGPPYACATGTLTGGPQKCIPLVVAGAADQLDPDSVGGRESADSSSSSSSVVPGMADSVALNVLIGAGTAIFLLAVVLAVILFRKRRAMKAIHAQPEQGGPGARPLPAAQPSPLAPATHWFANEVKAASPAGSPLPLPRRAPPATPSVPNFASPADAVHLQLEVDEPAAAPGGELHLAWVYVNPDAEAADQVTEMHQPKTGARGHKEEPVSIAFTPRASSAALALPSCVEPHWTSEPEVADPARSVSDSVAPTNLSPLPQSSSLSASSMSVGGVILPPPRAPRGHA